MVYRTDPESQLLYTEVSKPIETESMDSVQTRGLWKFVLDGYTVRVVMYSIQHRKNSKQKWKSKALWNRRTPKLRVPEMLTFPPPDVIAEAESRFRKMIIYKPPTETTT